MLKNGFKNRQLDEWKKIARMYQNVKYIKIMPELFKDRFDEYLQYDPDLKHLADAKGMYIAYSTKDYEMAARLVIDEDLVIVELEGYKNCPEDEMFYEYYGKTTHEKFWEMLERSIPDFKQHWFE